MSKRGAGIIRGTLFEAFPAAIFGGASGFCTAVFLALPPLSTTPVAAGAAALGCSWLMLRRLGAPRRLYLPQFAIEEFEPQAADFADEPEELLLEDRLDEDELVLENEFHPAAADEELVLENPLPLVEEDSRVIRLFDPAKMQTAGEMQARIEQHLRDAPRPGMPDATQELHEALAALRQSLR